MCMNNGMMIVTFECKKCGWSWLGNFVHCPYCKGSDAHIIDYETLEDWIERMALIRELQMNDSYFVIEEFEIE